jgi:hypothetical protein
LPLWDCAFRLCQPVDRFRTSLSNHTVLSRGLRVSEDVAPCATVYHTVDRRRGGEAASTRSPVVFMIAAITLLEIVKNMRFRLLAPFRESLVYTVK